MPQVLLYVAKFSRKSINQGYYQIFLGNFLPTIYVYYTYTASTEIDTVRFGYVNVQKNLPGDYDLMIWGPFHSYKISICLGRKLSKGVDRQEK